MSAITESDEENIPLSATSIANKALYDKRKSTGSLLKSGKSTKSMQFDPMMLGSQSEINILPLASPHEGTTFLNRLKHNVKSHHPKKEVFQASAQDFILSLDFNNTLECQVMLP